MTLSTRKPTGRPSWPLILVAGSEKVGKTWACAQASASDLVGRTLWIGCGEDDPDDLASLPGVDFDIVEHDGTYKQVLQAVYDASAEPADDKPNLIIFDSMTRLWDLLKDEAQVVANRRAAAKGKKQAEVEAQITMDLWNKAKGRWTELVVALKNHPGPVVVTARLEQITLMEDGQPTKDKDWKIQAEKTLAYDVGAIVEIPFFGEPYLTGVRSARYKRQPGEKVPYPDFSVEKLWRDLGLADDVETERRHQVSSGSESVAAEDGTNLNAAKDRVWKAHRGAHPNLSDADRKKAVTKLIKDKKLDAGSVEDLDGLAKELATVDPWTGEAESESVEVAAGMAADSARVDPWGSGE